MSADSGLLVINPVIFKKMGFSPELDFKPVGLLARLHLLIVVQPDHPANSFSELVAWIRAQKEPVPYAASGVGSPLHVAMARLGAELRLNLLQIPYKGAAPAISDFLAKGIGLMCIDYSSAAQHIKAGKMKVLAVTAAKRIAALPHIPTVSEAGGPTNFDASAWQGVVAPAGTPDEIVSRLNKALVSALGQRSVIDRLSQLGVEPTPSTAAEFTAYWRRESKLWQPLVRALELSAD
jgi:tripartite-type tricarboxylate transporter receptor subunit TctC